MYNLLCLFLSLTEIIYELFFPQDGDKTAGINVKRGVISSMQDENVLQPALVTSNVIQLASETVCSILKIDDIVNTIR